MTFKVIQTYIQSYIEAACKTKQTIGEKAVKPDDNIHWPWKIKFMKT